MKTDSFRTGTEQARYKYYQQFYGKVIAFLLTKLCTKKVFLNHLEIPVTTCCTLRCKNCANLIQYYCNPSHTPAEQVTGNLASIISSVNGIGLLRILGGEPLLHPGLYDILAFCLNEVKINRLEIVTNGTLLFPEKIIELLSGNCWKGPDFKVCISDYSTNSAKMDLLVQQLKSADIPYRVESGRWKAAGNVLRREWDISVVEKMFQQCYKCVSLLNGELHICPRSSHGTDLQLVPKWEEEYIRLSEYENDRTGLRAAICSLLNRPYVEACYYCDGNGKNALRTVVAGEQCSRHEALTYFDEARKQNERLGRNSF